MKKLLDGEHPLLEKLRLQLEQGRVSGREFTGVGFFTDFEVDTSLAYGSVNLELGDIHTDKVEDIQSGIGFILFIREGRLAFLEGFTYGEEQYPENISLCTLYYLWKDQPQLREERDWNGLFERLNKKPAQSADKLKKQKGERKMKTNFGRLSILCFVLSVVGLFCELSLMYFTRSYSELLSSLALTTIAVATVLPFFGVMFGCIGMFRHEVPRNYRYIGFALNLVLLILLIMSLTASVLIGGVSCD